MAEGGGVDDDEEQSYLPLSGLENEGRSVAGKGDIFGLHDEVASPASEENNSWVNEGDETNRPRKKVSDDNPFSFKKFLEHASAKFDNRGCNKRQNGQSDLPDFVQDHYSSDSSWDRSLNDLSLPDLTSSQMLDVNRPKSDLDKSDFPRETDGSNSHSKGLWPWNANAPASTSFVFPNMKDSETPQQGSNLPYFLSGGIFSNGDLGARHPKTSLHVNKDQEVVALEVNGDIELELIRLRKVNKDLQKQLSRVQEEVETESNRVDKVMKEMEDIRKQEKEETASLEKMVRKVEANLRRTTQRAVEAEHMVAMLKKEIKTLQGQVKSLNAENVALKSGDKTVLHLKDRSKHASNELSAAAATAEKSLRKLLDGVEILKTLSKFLSTTTDISEEVPSEDKTNS